MIVVRQWRFQLGVAISLCFTICVIFAWGRDTGTPSTIWSGWQQRGVADAMLELKWEQAPGFGIPYWMLLVVTLILPMLAVRRRLMWEFFRKGKVFSHCPTCGYDLRASRDRCPECGTPFHHVAPLVPPPKPRVRWRKDRAAILWRIRHVQ